MNATTTTTTTKRYEISWESENGSGSVFVLADSEDKALEQFDCDWSEHGDDVPSRWVSATWSNA